MPGHWTRMVRVRGDAYEAVVLVVADLSGALYDEYVLTEFATHFDLPMYSARAIASASVAYVESLIAHVV